MIVSLFLSVLYIYILCYIIKASSIWISVPKINILKEISLVNNRVRLESQQRLGDLVAIVNFRIG